MSHTTFLWLTETPLFKRYMTSVLLPSRPARRRRRERSPRRISPTLDVFRYSVVQQEGNSASNQLQLDAEISMRRGISRTREHCTDGFITLHVFRPSPILHRQAHKTNVRNNRQRQRLKTTTVHEWMMVVGKLATYLVCKRCISTVGQKKNNVHAISIESCQMQSSPQVLQRTRGIQNR
jgi:hypothetical protein